MTMRSAWPELALLMVAIFLISAVGSMLLFN
jgi:hypothetical protein